MDKDEGDILLENAKEYYSGALEAEKKANYVKMLDRKPRLSRRGCILNILKTSASSNSTSQGGVAHRFFDNTSGTLYFKSFASLLDYYIYLKKGIIPKSHTDRFRILEKDYPDLYRKIDGDFEFYQRSYRERLTKEACEVLKKDAKELFELLNIEI